jgi:hypothetical protein
MQCMVTLDCKPAIREVRSAIKDANSRSLRINSPNCASTHARVTPSPLTLDLFIHKASIS